MRRLKVGIIAFLLVLGSLFCFAACGQSVDQQKVDAVIEAIAELPEEDELALAHQVQLNEVIEMYEALTAEEQALVTNYGDLALRIEKMDSLVRVRDVRMAIADLPSPELVSRSDADAVQAVRALYDALTEEEQAQISNYEKLLSLEEALSQSGWVENTHEFYVQSGDTEDLVIGFRLVGEAKSLTVDGAALDADEYTVTLDNIIVKNEVLQSLSSETYHKFVFTDDSDKQFGFIVYKDIEENAARYFDFDTIIYTNPDPAMVKNEIVEEGIDGSSLHVSVAAATGNAIFGFYGGGEFGFVQYTFTPNTTYRFSFKMLVNSYDSSNVLNIPVHFGSPYDVGYIRVNEEGLYWSNVENDLLKNINVKLEKDPENGKLYTIDMIFTTPNEEGKCINFYMGLWKIAGAPETSSGSFDAYLDDIFLRKMSDAYTASLFIEALPDTVGAADYKAVYLAKEQFDALTEEQKADVSQENKDKLSAAYAAVLEARVGAVEAVITALPDESSAAVGDWNAVCNAVKVYEELLDFEQEAVQNRDKLFAVQTKVSDLRVKDVIAKIEALPAADEMAAEDYAALFAARDAYLELTEQERGKVTNYEKLSELIESFASSFTDGTVYYHGIADGALAVGLDLKNNTVTGIFVDGTEVDASAYSYDGEAKELTFTEDWVTGISEGSHSLTVADNRGTELRFTVIITTDGSNMLFYDWDNTSYINESDPSHNIIPEEVIVENGIDGKSLQINGEAVNGTIIGFHPQGSGYAGFAPYNFVTGKAYMLNFDLKVLSKTHEKGKEYSLEFRADATGGLGTIYYNIEDGYWLTATNNAFYASFTENSDGSISVRAVLIWAKDTFLQLSSYNMPVTLQIDNLYLSDISDTTYLNMALTALSSGSLADNVNRIYALKATVDSLEDNAVNAPVKERYARLYASALDVAIGPLVDSIDALPAVSEVTPEDLPAIQAALAAYNALSAEEKAAMADGDNFPEYAAAYEKLVELQAAAKFSEWTDERYIFDYRNADISIGFKLAEDAEISCIKLEGRTLEEGTDYSYADGTLTLKNSLLSALSGYSEFILQDSKNGVFLFGVLKDLNETDIFYDADEHPYDRFHSGMQYPNCSVSLNEAGIMGATYQHVNTASANIIAFQPQANEGFLAYTFVAGGYYHLTFDIKVLATESADLWIYANFFNGDRVLSTNYVISANSWRYESLSGTIVSLIEYPDGTARISVMFRAPQENYTQWGLCVNAASTTLLDNVCLRSIAAEEFADAYIAQLNGKVTDENVGQYISDIYAAEGTAAQASEEMQAVYDALLQKALAYRTKSVIAMIDALPETDTENAYIEEILEAYAAMSGLNEQEKEFVGAERLEKLNALYAALPKAELTDENTFYQFTGGDVAVGLYTASDSTISVSGNNAEGSLSAEHYSYDAAEGILTLKASVFENIEGPAVITFAVDAGGIRLAFSVGVGLDGVNYLFFDEDNNSFETWLSQDAANQQHTGLTEWGSAEDGIAGSSYKVTGSAGSSPLGITADPGAAEAGGNGVYAYIKVEANKTYTVSFDIKFDITEANIGENYWIYGNFRGDGGDRIINMNAQNNAWVVNSDVSAKWQVSQSAVAIGDGVTRVTFTFTVPADRDIANLENGNDKYMGVTITGSQGYTVMLDNIFVAEMPAA